MKEESIRFILIRFQLFLTITSIAIYVVGIGYQHILSQNSLEIVYVVSFLFIVFTSLKFFPTISAFNLFLLGYFMFQVSAVIFSYSTINERELMQTHFYFSSDVICKTLEANLVVLNSIYLGALFYMPSSNPKILFQYNPSVERLGLFLIFGSLPLTLYKFWLEISLISSQGYYAYYTNSLNIPFYISIFRVLFEFGYFIFVSSYPSKKVFKRISLIYLLVISLFFLVGVRNRVILSILFVIWVYYRFYTNKSPKLLIIGAIAFIGIFVLLLVQYIRQAGIFTIVDNRSLISYFFFAQSTNFYVLPLVQYFDLEQTIPYLFTPIFQLVSGFFSPDSDINLLGNDVAYHISPTGFYQGQGIGSSFIAEIFPLGLLGLVIIPFIMGLSTGYFEKSAAKYRSVFAISFYFITNCVYISRSSLFRNVTLAVIFLVIYILFIKRINWKHLIPKLKIRINS